MSIRRFTAATSREAMAQIKRELGDEALIVSTRSLPGGRVEIVAATPDAMDALIAKARSGRQDEAAPVVPEAEAPPKLETFSDYLRRQSQAQARAAARAAAADEEAMPTVEQTVVPTTEGETGGLMARRDSLEAIVAGATATPWLPRRRRAPMPTASAKRADPVRAPQAPGEAATTGLGANAEAAVAARADARLLEEMQAMRALLLEQRAAMAAAAAADLHRRNPAQVRVMTRLLTAGFSNELARQLAAEVPADMALDQCEGWLLEVLAVDLRCVAEHAGIVERGGVFALVGPTGVGKTTTVAKLAARFAALHGAGSLGLITLDAYRVGAHEQLQTYGRILGTPVHLAQDTATLAEVLAAMGRKRLVLIDTCGVSQRDERLEPMLEMLSCAGTPERPVQRVLLLNAASHAETLDAVARAWNAREAGMAILTKLDEAVCVGGALDVALRNQLLLLGATNGQRVPEDWLAIASEQLAELALRPGAAPFAFSDDEAALLASAPAAAQAVRA